ncbi:MAG: GntR family transcriptional regulator [Rhodospirillales bacterium]|nr:GntR family transcriptional regulator [Rhodospirillales bacterium]
MTDLAHTADAGPPGDAFAGTRIDRKLPTAPQVYDRLRALIVSLAVPPGASLSPAMVAKRLGLSLTPVREALLKLEEEGLVDIIPQSGTRVSRIGVQRAREAHFLRVSVELEVVRRAAGMPARPEIEALKAILARQGAALERGDMTEFIAQDHEFHRSLCEIAGVGGLWAFIRTRSGQLDRLRHLHLPTPGKTRSVIEEHKRILRAVTQGNPEEAQKHLRAHLSGTLAQVETLQRLHPTYIGA